MDLRKGVVGGSVVAAVALGLGTFAGFGYASDYAPTMLGNSAYTNQVDERNAYIVEGVYYVGSISNQNAETVEAARALATTIGQASDTASPIMVTNGTGKEITEFAFCTQESDYTGNLLSGALAVGESACWFYEYDYVEHDYVNGSGVTVSMPCTPTVKVTFADGTTGEFHNLNINGVRTVDLRFSDEYGVYYVERTTITNHTPDPNLYYEVNLSEYEGAPAEFDYHVNSGGRMGDRMYTASRGDAWAVGPDELPDMADYGIELPLNGVFASDFNAEVYASVEWNRDNVVWRAYNNE